MKEPKYKIGDWVRFIGDNERLRIGEIQHVTEKTLPGGIRVNYYITTSGGVTEAKVIEVRE